MADVMVIAGTADAREIVGELYKNNISMIATVATSFGGQLLNTYPDVETLEGRLTREDMVRIIKHSNVKLLVDASHPFAVEVSANAMSACKEVEIYYLRFERGTTCVDSSDITIAKSYEEAAECLNEMDGKIFLTIGSKNIEIFIDKIRNFRERIFVRVLPQSNILLECESKGLTAENIIATKGPFSEDMNLAMIKHCGASVLVTKDSGDIGGTREKISACKKLGVKVILVKRPEVDYGNRAGTLEEVVINTRRYLEGVK